MRTGTIMRRSAVAIITPLRPRRLALLMCRIVITSSPTHPAVCRSSGFLGILRLKVDETVTFGGELPEKDILSGIARRK